jgi:hypothetical protein
MFNFHVPRTQNVQSNLPAFMLYKGELICPKKLFKKEQYPEFPCDMVKISGMNGQNILVPFNRLTNISSMDV